MTDWELIEMASKRLEANENQYTLRQICKALLELKQKG